MNGDVGRDVREQRAEAPAKCQVRLESPAAQGFQVLDQRVLGAPPDQRRTKEEDTDPHASVAGVEIFLCFTDAVRDPDLLHRCEALLDPLERARHGRFLGDEDRHLFLVSHALIRLVLSRYASVAPEVWRFRRGPHGRPEIDTPGVAGLDFSLSHTRGLVAAAIAHRSAVGVDVEAVDPRRATSEIAARFFSAPEIATLAGLSGEARVDRFFDFWTLKESYVKARGAGLSLPLDKFWFTFLPARALALGIDPAIDDRSEEWSLALYRARTAHRVACAVRRSTGDDPLPRVYEISPFGRDRAATVELLART